MTILPCGTYRIGGSTNFDVPPLETFSLPSLPPGFEDVFDGIDFEDNTFGRMFFLSFRDDYLTDDSGIRKVKAIALAFKTRFKEIGNDALWWVGSNHKFMVTCNFRSRVSWTGHHKWSATIPPHLLSCLFLFYHAFTYQKVSKNIPEVSKVNLYQPFAIIFAIKKT